MLLRAAREGGSHELFVEMRGVSVVETERAQKLQPVRQAAVPPLTCSCEPGGAIFSAPVIAGRDRAAGAAALSRSRSKPLQALHSLGKRPERAVQSDILVDAIDGACLAAADATIAVWRRPLIPPRMRFS